ncbi:DMT family transporter [Amphibiibacter pelophylacis]|uniref:DMT family transporter n=1 Tax=Amphibiibacter pelophylacis TaxID=1799477 RepID=A0ACC6NYF2_9BURK
MTAAAPKSSALYAQLVLLAAIWGGSFLFMRMGGGEFGPVALAGLRVIGAGLLLWPLLMLRGQTRHVWPHAGHILVVGLLNSALPFLCYAYATRHITAGASAIFNASTPLWSAVIAWLWLGDRLGRTRVLGLALGFGGVVALAGSRASGASGSALSELLLAVLACLAATMMYGVAANYAKRHLAGVPSMAVAAGSNAFAGLLMVGPTIWFWPAQPPSAGAWVAMALLALVCTGVAYVLYYHLIQNLGPSNASSVTFLVPLFAALWGWVVLSEPVTLDMIAAGSVIFAGTALVMGLAERLLARRRAAPLL